MSGYAGHPAHLVEAAPGSRVLAELVELTGDLSNAATATATTLGLGIVLTDKTAYIANQVLELIGGMLQAHLNVEAVRHWANATHWGDTLLFFLRRVLLETGLGPLWETRLRSFGAYDGVLSFRHDVHGMRDYSFLDYQIQNLIPASYDIEDPAFPPTSPKRWPRLGEAHDAARFIEPALHNDSSIGDPPTCSQRTVRARVQRRQELGFHLHLRPPRRRAHAPRRSTRWITLRARRAHPGCAPSATTCSIRRAQPR